MGSSQTQDKAIATMGRMKFALGFSGRIKSGKTTIARRVATELNVPFASFGDYLRTVVAARGLDSSDRTIQQDVGQELFESDLSGFCTDVLISAGWKKGMCVVVDGIRHVHVLEELKKILEPVSIKLVYINIADQLQAQRLIDSGSMHSLELVQSHQTEADVLDRLVQIADWQINGDGKLGDCVDLIVSHVVGT